MSMSLNSPLDTDNFECLHYTDYTGYGVFT